MHILTIFKVKGIDMVTFEDLEKLAEKEDPEKVHPDEAMRRLGPEFARLRECKNGKDFMDKLGEIFFGMKSGRISHGEISLHTLIGLCQLAHSIRDQVGPANQKSFNRFAIPWLLKRRDRVRSNPPEEGIIEYMCRTFDDRNNQHLQIIGRKRGFVSSPGLDFIGRFR